jgi:hypothetical protein
MYYTLQSQEILNRPAFVLQILKSLNRFWTFWTLTENSDQILNILNIDWTESKHCRKRLSILNSIGTDSEHSEHCLKSMNRFLTFWKVWTESEHSEHCLKSLHILSRVWTFFLNKSCDISRIYYFFYIKLQQIYYFIFH